MSDEAIEDVIVRLKDERDEAIRHKEAWKSRAENFQNRLRSIQGKIKAPDLVFWMCPHEGCGQYTYGKDWQCIHHPDDKVVPVRMVKSDIPLEEDVPDVAI